MTQFDGTTERLAQAESMNYGRQMLYKRGRNSCLESLEILAKQFEWFLSEYNEWEADRMHIEITAAIAAVKARGDWPLND